MSSPVKAAVHAERRAHGAPRNNEEVAAAVRFLASPEAEFASGAVLDLNGASYLRL